MCIYIYIYICIYVYRRLGGRNGRQPSPRREIVLPCLVACLLACTHARFHARTHTLNSRVAHPKKLPGPSVCPSVPLSSFHVFCRFFWICLSTRTVFLTNVSRISLSWPIWKAGVAIRTRLHEEFECLCCLCQLNCYFARVFDGFWSCQLS